MEFADDLDFESAVTPAGQIALRPELAGEIPVGEQLRVVVMWGPLDSDAAWRSAGRSRFEAACCPGDAVYEQLVDESASR